MAWWRGTVDLEDPLPRWAGGRVIGHRDRTKHDGTLRLEEMGVGYGIERQRFEGAIFDARGANLPTQGLFSRCTFIRCAFRGPITSLRFQYCRLIDCNFLCNNAAGIIERQQLNFTWCELRGAVGGGVLDDRRSGVFSFVQLTETRFENCLLDRIRFDAKVAFDQMRLFRVQGLPSCIGLDQVRVAEAGSEEMNRDLAETPLGLLDRFASWERLRTFGRLPLFGTSLTALVTIPLLFFFLALFNDQLRRLQSHAGQGSPPSELAAMILALQPISLPALSFWLLVSTLLLGIGATLFALLCPSRVREFSLDRWTDELRQSALRYLPLSWSRRWARAIAAPCFLIGGGGTVAILLVKLWNAGAFIVRNTTMPW